MKSLYFIVRGCGWCNGVQRCRHDHRDNDRPGWRGSDLGFRIFQEYK